MRQNQIDQWRGAFGDAYVDRNQADERRLRASVAMWAKIIDRMSGDPPRSILEVGANIGANLRSLARVTDAELYALEPNARARSQLEAGGVLPTSRILDGMGQSIPLADESVDLAFTCGVLIHIPPSDLLSVCREMYRCAKKYIVCVEYFSVEPEEQTYRGEEGLLFKRDFGGFWLDNFPGLTTVDVGFNWKRTTGLDNSTWWILKK